VAVSVLYMSMSLDGYIAGLNDEPGNPGGDRFMRLHEWFVTGDGEFYRPTDPAGQLIDEFGATGAAADRGADRPLGRRPSRRPDLRAQPSAARPVSRGLPAGHVRR
jgi:hypothetical protein